MNKVNFIVAAIFLMLCVTAGMGQTNTFTYQGRLTDGGAVANGTYDMQFKLFDGANNQIGSTNTVNPVSATNGVFTVQLNFGAAAFSGDDRFLEIGMRPAGNGDPYTVLSPRQSLTSTPYAIRAGNATTADTAGNASQLGGIAANQYVVTNDSRLSDARTPTAGSSNYIQNTNSPQAANFNIAGKGTAANLSADVVNADTKYTLGGLTVIKLSNQFQSLSVGPNAGQLTSGGANAFFGWSAGANTTAGDNSFFGWAAGDHNIAGSKNSFFGAAAGASNTTGTDNSSFGYRAGWSNQDGIENSFFGSSAGKQGATGNRNAFFGFEAGFANTNNDNSFFGWSAGQANTTGNRNSYLGKGAGLKNKTGTDNTIVGIEAGEENTANDNSFFGSRSGNGNTTGTRNAYFGAYSGAINDTTSDNSLFGYSAGIVSRGSSNSFFGSNAGAKNITGFANSLFGFEAGNATSGGFNNSFFGRGAGKANIDGSSNTALGAFAEFDSANLSFATAIGAGAHVGASNTVVLGRSSDAVQVPGTLVVNNLGTVGLTSVCRNALNQISVCSSSLRYKTNIQPFIGGLSVLNRLRPITFDWKQGGLHDVGFGAEDVAQVEPLLVIHNDQGEVEGVKYDRITAVLVNAVKEQQEQIRQQQTEIQSLKALLCRRNRRARVCK